MTQGIDEQIGAIPAIEPEGHFFKIGCEMLCAESMPSTSDSALQETERGFYGIGMSIAVNVDSVLMADGLVGAASESSFHHGLRIGAPFIGHNHVNVLADVLADIFCKGSRLCIAGMKETQIAATLTDTNKDLFVVLKAATCSDSLAADIGFVYFHFTVEHISLAFDHGRPDSMAEIPCCLVAADSNGALDLASRHAFLGFAEQERSSKPFRKGQMRIIENRASGHGELIIALLAVEELLFSLQLDHGAFAAKALRPLWEPQAGEQFPTLGIGREQGIHVN